jgi:lactoylglutathione lyase
VRFQLFILEPASNSYDFPEWKFGLYFLAILPEGEISPPPGTPESEDYLWNMNTVCLELTHNYGTENDAAFKVNDFFRLF